MTESERNAKLQDLLAYIHSKTQVEAFAPQCTVVVPRNERAKPLFIVKLHSTVHANYLRINKWSIFKEQGLYVGEDLTISE
jgi:hypothetical protein